MRNKLLIILSSILFLSTNICLADKLCPTCENVFDDSIKFCPEDGTKLNEIPTANSVKIEFKSLPEGSKIILNGERLHNKSKVDLKIGRTYKFEIEADGYKKSLFIVSPQEKNNLVVEPYLSPLSPEENRNKKINAIASEQYGDMIEIKSGVYSVGSNRGNLDEKPVRRYETQGFWIDRTEVTCAQYKKFLDDIEKYGHKWCHPNESKNKDHTPYHTYAWALKFSWVGGQPPYGMDDYPVVLVDWFDAYAYANWAGKRLPTENEWEIAARGIVANEYPWGNTFSLDRCNVGEAPMAVGSFPKGSTPNGILDMAGNVCEWTATAYDPKPGNAYNFAGKYGLPIVKGGSWDDNAKGCRSSARDNKRSPYHRSTTVGFRCISDHAPNLLKPGK